MPTTTPLLLRISKPESTSVDNSIFLFQVKSNFRKSANFLARSRVSTFRSTISVSAGVCGS